MERLLRILAFKIHLSPIKQLEIQEALGVRKTVQKMTYELVLLNER
jgi:hypothetical protein